MRSRFSFLITLLAVLAFPAESRGYVPPASPAARPFVYPGDAFDFKNESIWYDLNNTAHPRKYGGHCFVLARASVQFWKFARFDPDAAPLPPAQLAHRIRQVCGRSVWLPAFSPRDRVAIPGYHDLREASADNRYVFQTNIGHSWPFYLRFCNIIIAFWVTRALEDRLNGEIYHDLQMNTPTIIWMYRFPTKLNHVVVVYSCRRDDRGYHYLVYDTNYRDAPKHLDYDPKTRTFYYEPVYYFKGGPVTVRALYRGLLQ